jgi:3',5'-cyclic AMP phosphodiesterase CpdA
MRKIAHLSDLHFGRTDPQAVESLVEDISADPPDLVVVSGDLTLRARRSEFAEARAFLGRLPAPSFAVPGNHDITPFLPIERFAYPYRRWRSFISPIVEPSLRDEEMVLLGINTARPMTLHWNWARGSISRRQISRVRSELEGLPSKLFRIVVAHHPFIVPQDAPDAHLVSRSALALDSFSRSGVDLVLSGHLHRAYQRPLEEALNPSSHPNRPMAVLHASTATSTRLRGERNAYNLVAIDRGALTVTVREWDGVRWSNAIR